MIKSIKKHFRKYTKPELMLFALALVQIAYLMIFNILRTRYVINSDSSEYLVQVMQIWKQGTLLIEDYYYSTMLTWDMPTLIAVPFYGLFKDVFLAYGMANNVLIILFALVLNKLCNDLDLSKGAKWLVFLATYTVYHYGFIDYMDELFVNGALYGFRLMFMLMLMDVVICIHKNNFEKKDIVLYLLSLIGFFVCGISSGIFAAGCCVLPIILFAAWNVLCQKEKIKIIDFFQIKVIVPILAIVACMAGVVVNYLLGFSGSAASDKMTISILDMGQNLQNVLISFFQLFGWSETNINLISIRAIMQICGFVAACVVIGAFVFVSFFSLKKDKKDITKIQRTYGQMVVCVFLVNFLLFILADLTYGATLFEYRYWLIVVVPVYLEIGIIYDWLKKHSYNHWVALSIVYVVLLFGISGYKDIKMWREDNGADYYEQLMNIAEEKNIDHIYSYADFFSSRVVTAFAKENMDVFAITYNGVEDDGQTWYENQLRMSRWGNYVKYDRDCLLVEEERNLGLIVVDYLGEDYNYLIPRAKEVISAEGSSFKLLVMDENYIDFVYGLPEPEMMQSRDYFNWGYNRLGVSLNDAGYYQSTGSEGVILEGAFTASESGDYNATVQYEICEHEQEIPAYIVISVTDNNNNVIEYRQSLEKDKTEATIDSFSVKEGDTYKVSIISENGTVLLLKQIDYFRMK